MTSLCVLSVAPALQVLLKFSPSHPFLCTSLEFSCLPPLQVSLVQVLGRHLHFGSIYSPPFPAGDPLLVTERDDLHVIFDSTEMVSSPCSHDPKSKQSHLPIFSLIAATVLGWFEVLKWSCIILVALTPFLIGIFSSPFLGISACSTWMFSKITPFSQPTYVETYTIVNMHWTRGRIHNELNVQSKFPRNMERMNECCGNQSMDGIVFHSCLCCSCSLWS